MNLPNLDRALTAYAASPTAANREAIRVACSIDVPAALGASVAQAPQSVPDGWKLVPLVLTQAMDEAADSAKRHFTSNQHMWDSALAAAPTPPAAAFAADMSAPTDDELLGFIEANRDSAMSMKDFIAKAKGKLAARAAAPVSGPTEVERLTMELQNQREFTQHWKAQAGYRAAPVSGQGDGEAAPEKDGAFCPVVLELPAGENRYVRVVFDQLIEGERVLCIAIEDAAPSSDAESSVAPEQSEDSAAPAPIQSAELAELKRLAEAATPGPWGSDSIKSDGEYGTDDNGGVGYDAYVVTDARGHALMDSLNRDDSSINVDGDSDGAYAWDELAKRDAAYIAAANPAVILRLLAALAAPAAAPAQASSEPSPYAKALTALLEKKAILPRMEYEPLEAWAFRTICELAQPEQAMPTDLQSKLRKTCDPEDFGVPAQYAKCAHNFAVWLATQEAKPTEAREFQIVSKNNGTEAWLTFKNGAVSLNNIAHQLGPITKQAMGNAIIRFLAGTSPAATPARELTDADIVADPILRHHFGMNGGAGPVSAKGWSIINAARHLTPSKG